MIIHDLLLDVIRVCIALAVYLIIVCLIDLLVE